MWNDHPNVWQGWALGRLGMQGGGLEQDFWSDDSCLYIVGCVIWDLAITHCPKPSVKSALQCGFLLVAFGKWRKPTGSGMRQKRVGRPELGKSCGGTMPQGPPHLITEPTCEWVLYHWALPPAQEPPLLSGCPRDKNIHHSLFTVSIILLYETHKLSSFSHCWDDVSDKGTLNEGLCCLVVWGSLSTILERCSGRSVRWHRWHRLHSQEAGRKESEDSALFFPVFSFSPGP